MGVPSIGRAWYVALLELMGRLGLMISEKKLVVPSTQVVCLGVLIDTEKGTISIPPEKMKQINLTVCQWITKKHRYKTSVTISVRTSTVCSQMGETCVYLPKPNVGSLAFWSCSQKDPTY